MNNIKQVIIIRKDLNMRRGKEISSGSHASNHILVDAFFERLDSKQIILTEEWLRSGYRKITLQCESEDKLKAVHELAKSKGLSSYLVEDLGYTEFHGVPTLTACAIGPDYSDLIDEITGPNGLLPLKLY